MAKNKMTWFGDEFYKKAEDTAVKNLTKVAIMAHNDLKETLGEKRSPPVSQPGQIPHMQHGELRRSITWEVDHDKKVARVGSNKHYGKYLELGTSKMAARPWLRPTMRKNMKKYKRVMGS